MNLKVNDPWASLRLNLYRNIEPKVELVGRTSFMGDEETGGDPYGMISPDRIPGYVARMSYQSESSPEGDVRLTKSLLKKSPMAHTGPFEFSQWIFRITGISKSCLTQFDRHRIGVGFVQMSGRFMSRGNNSFVYNLYDYLPEDTAKMLLNLDAEHNLMCIQAYERLKNNGVTKQDSRKVLPVSMATGTYVHMNSVSLRNFFKLRLDSHAEWEIRRMAGMMLDKVMRFAPSHFEDIINANEAVPASEGK